MGIINIGLQVKDTKVQTRFNWKDISMIDISMALLYLDLIRDKLKAIAEKNSDKTGNWDEVGK